MSVSVISQLATCLPKSAVVVNDLPLFRLRYVARTTDGTVNIEIPGLTDVNNLYDFEIAIYKDGAANMVNITAKDGSLIGGSSTYTLSDDKEFIVFRSSPISGVGYDIVDSASGGGGGLPETPLALIHGGTGSTTGSGARSNLGAAGSGDNSDITSLSGLTTALSIGQGGTGATSVGGARAALMAAASGPNSDITSLTGLTTPLSVLQGGTGATTISGAQAALGVAASTNVMLLDGSQAMTGNMSVGGFKITNSATPTSASDLVTKQYADTLFAAASAGETPLAAVRMATTGNITLSGLQTIDGVVGIAGDSVLVKNQSTGSQNGVYQQAVGAWTRRADQDANGEVVYGNSTVVLEGTTLAGSKWFQNTPDPVVVGTTTQVWIQTGVASNVVAGDGMTQSGNTLNVVGTANRIVANPDSIDIAATYVGQTSMTTLGTITTGVWNGTPVDVTHGGTGGTTASTARSGIGAAASGTNSDITSLTGLTTPLSIAQGGTAGATAPQARTNLGVPAATAVMLLDGSQAMTNDLNVGGNQVINVGAPASATDAANRDYVDTNFVSNGAVGTTISAFKTTDTSRSLTTTMALDPELQVTLPGGLSSWHVQAELYYTGNATADLKYAFSGTQVGPTYWFWSAIQQNAGNNLEMTQRLQGSSDFSVAGASPTENRVVKIESITPPLLGGTFGIQWAQNVSNAQAVSVLIGSRMICTRIG